MTLNSRYLLPWLISFCLFATPELFAQSLELDLRTRLKSGKFTAKIKPSSSAIGCSYRIYASPSKKSLTGDPIGGTLVGITDGEEGTTSFLGQKIPSLKLPPRKPSDYQPPVHFRAQATCNDGTFLSNITSIRLKPTKDRGKKTLKRWIDSLKDKVIGGSVNLVTAFPNLVFDRPVLITNAGDGSDRLFVVEQGGLIKVFQNSDDVSSSSTFIDLTDQISTGGERGLLGLAFHPNFSTNRYFYVFYTKKTSGAVTVARYEASSGDPNMADSGSGLVILEIPHPRTNHNGAHLAFGPDGFLYIGVGDGGSGGDPDGNGQDRSTLLGDMLRIDVNSTSGSLNYSIPSTNPFVGNTSGFREEIFAYGLRNPYRFSFDFTTSRLWVADVGQAAREEINIMENGKNYGWNTMEGSLCYLTTNCNKSGLELPVHEYSHSQGSSITGGYVYRGTLVPQLKGLFLYADFIEGFIGAVEYNGQKATNINLIDTELNISGFGEAEDKEVFVLSYSDGKIFRFVSK